MAPPKDIAQDARDYFISEHEGCQAHAFGANDGKKLQLSALRNEKRPPREAAFKVVWLRMW